MKIAIFASGTGSNAVNIIQYFAQYPDIEFIILSNKASAPVLTKAKALNVQTYTFDKISFYETHEVVHFLIKNAIDYIILAGFLWLVPPNLINAFPKKIINIHPALLPKFGGKGFYGMNVHKAVIEAGETESGITIHEVNAEYDKGQIIFQAKCPIQHQDTPDTLAQKIHLLEYEHFPTVIAQWIGIS